MLEADAIRKWMTEHLRENQWDFAYKIPDNTKCAQGHLVGTGQKPFDLIMIGKSGVRAMEFKVASSGNPAAALNKMQPHQVAALTQIARVTSDNQNVMAVCVVYTPREYRKSGADPQGIDPYTYFAAGKNCGRCEFAAAPHHGVCKKCPFSENGEPRTSELGFT